MADSLYELLAPHLNSNTSTPSSIASSPTVTNYLSRLTTLSLSALSTTESQSLAQSANSTLLSLQALSSRSHKSVIATSNALSTLREHLPALTSSASSLRDGVPELDKKALDFSQKHSKSNTENAVLDRRKKAMLLSRNVDRVSDILELPTLLASAIASSSSPTSSSGSAATVVNYSQALDLFAHIKRLQILHPDSALIQSVLTEAEEAMKDMTSNLITSLRGQNIRLAAAIRTIGWLKRVAPELATQGLPLSSAKPAQGSTYSSGGSSVQLTSEGSFGYLFLTCRLYNLINMLEALAPLRDLADQETQQRLQRQGSPSVTSLSSDQSGTQRKPSTYGHSAFTGQQTERYLKRYIEIFREQSFATVSMYKNIFPAASDNTTTDTLLNPSTEANTSLSTSTPIPHPAPAAATSPAFLTPPQPLSTFPTHLISLLTSTLQKYLPNLTDPSARDSLLMQVLYAAGSLGRLGADFSMVVESLLDEDDEDDHEEGEGEEEEENRHQVSEVDVMNEKSAEAETKEESDADDAPSHQPEKPREEQSAKPKPEPNPKPKLTHKDKDQAGLIPEWIRILQKHRLQSSKLEALSSSSSSSSSPPPPPPSNTQEQKQKQKQTRLPARRGSSQDAVVK